MAEPRVGTRMTPGGIDWTAAPGYVPSDVAWALESVQGPDACVVKSSMARSVVFVPHGQGPRWVVKHYKCRGLRDVAKAALAGSKARYEWTMAWRFIDIGIPTARPVAYGERRHRGIPVESWLITEEIPDCVTLRDLCSREPHAPLLSREQRRSLVRQLADILARLHNHGIYHSDLHSGNFLVCVDAGSARLHLLDLHAARALWRPLSLSQILHNMAMLFASTHFPGVRRTERLRALQSYCQAANRQYCGTKRLWALVEARAEALRARRLKSRSRRCMLHSSEFRFDTAHGCRTYRRRDFDPDATDAAIAAHDNACARGVLTDHVRKIDAKTRVSLVEVDCAGETRKVCVKEYCAQPLVRNLRNLFRRRPALASWAAAHALGVRGIDVALPLAARVPANPLARASSYVISEALDRSIGLDRYVIGTGGYPDARERRRALAAALGRHFRALHDKRVYHRDLKASNILVAEQAEWDWAFYVVDLDRVRFVSAVDRRRRALNLAQVHTSTPRRATATDRLWFLLAYCATPRLTPEAKAIAREVLALARQRQCIWET